jgi:hypothetical protein
MAHGGVLTVVEELPVYSSSVSRDPSVAAFLEATEEADRAS